MAERPHLKTCDDKERKPNKNQHLRVMLSHRELTYYRRTPLLEEQCASVSVDEVGFRGEMTRVHPISPPQLIAESPGFPAAGPPYPPTTCASSLEFDPASPVPHVPFMPSRFPHHLYRAVASIHMTLGVLCLAVAAFDFSLYVHPEWTGESCNHCTNRSAIYKWVPWTAIRSITEVHAWLVPCCPALVGFLAWREQFHFLQIALPCVASCLCLFGVLACFVSIFLCCCATQYDPEIPHLDDLLLLMADAEEDVVQTLLQKLFVHFDPRCSQAPIQPRSSLDCCTFYSDEVVNKQGVLLSQCDWRKPHMTRIKAEVVCHVSATARGASSRESWNIPNDANHLENLIGERSPSNSDNEKVELVHMDDD
ncbi:hypothetical protein CAPTEDRAFT_200938 [Capitella teleta]|uniref:Uncharacterized protein n=1 Tax=Capitella teleta TaxID=283909 RepID=R7T8F3_CAPTE|nr:hypothetical protein CAPTEDRAFT_200938 [Capitella teleta]|eukprot:ELT87665.1 hypothetical protein CAPTEDRAFT_200938 [Capitella teleta]